MIHRWKEALLSAAAMVFVSTLTPPVWAHRAPALSAHAAILVNGSTGQIIYARNIRGEFYPASITKIMTAYLAITHGWHDTVHVSVQAQDQIGSSAYLRAGQSLPMPKVVTAMMLVSGNDAAYAIAQTVGGTVPNFVRMMNRQARIWGAPGIHFDNPNGLPDPKHVVSALGMAVIAEHAMQNPVFRRIVSTKESTLPPDPTPRVYYNQNQLLYNFPGAVGIKIGYTIEADETIVGAARRHHLLLIEVLLKDTPAGLWPDAQNLLSWGFRNFRPLTLVTRGQRLGTLDVGGRRVPVRSAQGLTYTVEKTAHPEIGVQLAALTPHSNRPIRQHETIGEAEITVNRHLVAQVPVRAARAVAPLPPPLRWNWAWLLLPVAVAASLGIGTRRLGPNAGRRRLGGGVNRG